MSRYQITALCLVLAGTNLLLYGIIVELRRIVRALEKK